MAADTSTVQATLEKQIQQGPKRVTVADLATASGLAMDLVRDTLDHMIGIYNCRLQVTDQGVLIYDFGKKLQRRDAKSAKDYFASIRNFFWRGFQFICKSWIAITLVVYFLIFLALLVALLLSAGGGSSKKSGSRRSRGGGVSINLGRLFGQIFRWRTHTGDVRYERDNDGHDYRHYKNRHGIINKKKKGFIGSVYDFVFGPERVIPDPLHDHREAAAYLRRRNGLITTAEISALAGQKLTRAEDFFADLLYRFRGEAKVTENGAMYGEFPEIQHILAKEPPAPIIFYWDEYQPEYQLTGNSGGRNVAVFLMNGFNLIMSVFFLTFGFSGLTDVFQEREVQQVLMTTYRYGGIWAPIFLGWLPLFFSTTFYIVPLLRWLKIRRSRKQRKRENLKKRLTRAVFANLGETTPVQRLQDLANQNNIEINLNEKQAVDLLDELVLDLEGEKQVSENGKLLYAFPKLRLELQEMKRLRPTQQATPELGNIVFDTGEDPASPNYTTGRELIE